MGTGSGPFYGAKQIEMPPTCKTPGTIYETGIKPDKLILHIHFPIDLLDGIGKSNEQALVKELHGALLPVIERLFYNQWHKMAGRMIRGHKQLMPALWSDLATGETKPSEEK